MGIECFAEFAEIDPYSPELSEGVDESGLQATSFCEPLTLMRWSSR